MDNSNKIILDLCGGTGSWGKPYKDAGYDVRLVTLPDNDVLTYEPPENVYGVLAAPPCTEFSIAKDHRLPRDLDGGMKIVNACIRIIEKCNPKFWAIENPNGLLTKFLGKPKYSFQPWYFGDGWTKATHLWGGFNLPERQYQKYLDCPQLPGLYVRPGRKTASIAFNHKNHQRFIPQLREFNVDSDASFRAITPPGFAYQFFKVNQ